MDKAQGSNGPARGKAAKSRNSEVRKEQNRIASRAYREKRKQKLALLDSLLKSESQNSSSPQSETDDIHSALPVIQSRQASESPVPQHATELWPSVSHLPPINHFGGETVDDLWMNGFDDRSTDMFAAGSDFVSAFDHDHMANHLAETAAAAQYLSTIPSIPALPPMVHMPLDPMLSDDHMTHYEDQSTHLTSSSASTSTTGISKRDSSIYDESSFGSDQDSPMIAALESFTKLDMAQQQQLLAVIQKQNGMPPVLAYDRTWDTPPSSVGKVATKTQGPGSGCRNRSLVAARKKLLPDPKVNHLQLRQIKFLAAIFANARAMEMVPHRLYHDDAISHFNIFNKKSRFANVTKDLRSTDSQLTIVHHPYLDCLPFVKFRDKTPFKLATDTLNFDEDEMCSDSLQGGIICWGGHGNKGGMGLDVPWGTRSWEPQIWFPKKYASVVGGWNGDM